MRHYLTYQHNVQRFFREHSEKYEGVVIPLSIATSFPTGTYGFVRALCSRHGDIQYAIDPRNALFQKAWDRANVRPPHEKMANVLGEPYITNALSRSLRPDDFDDEDVLAENVRMCIDFQKKFRMRSENERKLRKYKELLGLESMAPLKEPQHLIPPYYQFTRMSDPWYDVSMRSIREAVLHRSGIPVRPVLHFDRWVSISNWDSCWKTLKDLGVEEFWFYPNNFKEHEANHSELVGYIHSVEEAVKNGFQPYSLFGGYFAALLNYFGLCGFGNGVGYGEWRDSGYHKGGTAMTRIYILKLHRYVDAATAQNLIDRDPDYFGNDSDIVAGYVASGESVIDMSNQESLDHFMECRKQELDFVESYSLDEALAELDETVGRLKMVGQLESEKLGRSLQCWCQVLQQSA